MVPAPVAERLRQEVFEAADEVFKKCDRLSFGRVLILHIAEP
jgi:hypothetical protein